MRRRRSQMRILRAFSTETCCWEQKILGLFDVTDFGKEELGVAAARNG
jgi:hypothetical protein